MANTPIQDAPASLWALYRRTGDRTVRDAIAAHYLPLLRLVAGAVRKRRHVPTEIDAEDMAQDGYAGLHRAVERFDPSRGVRFTSFATWHIRGAMLDAFRGRDWVPRLARHRKERAPEILSLDHAVFGGCGGRAVRHVTLRPDQSVREPWSATSEAEQFERLISGLMPQEKLVLRMLYHDGLPIGVVAKRIGTDRSRISQVRDGALEYLRWVWRGRENDLMELAGMSGQAGGTR